MNMDIEIAMARLELIEAHEKLKMMQEEKQQVESLIEDLLQELTLERGYNSPNTPDATFEELNVLSNDLVKQDRINAASNRNESIDRIYARGVNVQALKHALEEIFEKTEILQDELITFNTTVNNLRNKLAEARMHNLEQERLDFKSDIADEVTTVQEQHVLKSEPKLEHRHTLQQRIELP